MRGFWSLFGLDEPRKYHFAVNVTASDHDRNRLVLESLSRYWQSARRVAELERISQASPDLAGGA
jgi:hypothetical protein